MLSILKLFKRPLTINIIVEEGHWARVFVDRDNMKQAAYEGVMKALEDFEKQHGKYMTEGAAVFCEDVTETFLFPDNARGPSITLKDVMRNRNIAPPTIRR